MGNLIFLTGTLLVYALAQAVQSALGKGLYAPGGKVSLRKFLGTISVLFHPVLVSVLVIMLILSLTHTPYEEYAKGTEGITFLLAPSVVALGVPLYREWKRLKAEMGRILVTVTFGSLVGIFSSVLPALFWGSPSEVIFSLAPRSVTTPIAMNIALATGGIPSLTASVVVATGIFGAVAGPVVLAILGKVEGSAFGLAMGVASHGIGTARALEIGMREGAYAALGLCLNGVLTSILVPGILPLCLFPPR